MEWMDFIMPSYRKTLNAFLLLLLWPLTVWSAPVVFHQPYLQEHQKQLTLTGYVEYDLSDALIEVLEHGYPIEWTLRMRLINTQSQQIEHKLNYEFSVQYRPLTQTYFIQNKTLNKSRDCRNLSRALFTLGSLENLPIIDLKAMKPETDYEVHLEFKWQQNKLPLTLNLMNFFNDDWALYSDPYTLKY